MQPTGTGPPAHAWLVIGTDATIVAADTAACLLFDAGASADLYGQLCTALVSPDDGAQMLQAFDLARAGRSWRGLLHRQIGRAHV